MRQFGSDHLQVLGESPRIQHRSHCSFALHKSSSPCLGDVVNVSVVVKLVIESYTKELYSLGQGDGIASNTDGTHRPVPVPGEHDDFSFKCAYVNSFGVSPFL